VVVAATVVVVAATVVVVAVTVVVVAAVVVVVDPATVLVVARYTERLTQSPLSYEPRATATRQRR
jgi:hypothetical protein